MSDVTKSTQVNPSCSDFPSLQPRVCHLTSVHPRNDIRIFLKECMSLSVAGFDVLAPSLFRASGEYGRSRGVL